jgi:hypothetical protein
MTPALRAVLLSPPFTPFSLFRNGENGTVQLPYNLSSMAKTSSGITPVSAAADTVGYVRDERYRLALGPELWNDASVAFAGESTRVSAGVYRIYSSAGALSLAGVPALTVGRSYEISFTIDSVTTAGDGITSDALSGTAEFFTTTGPKRHVIEAAGVTASIKRVSAACDYQVSNVSVREVLGNPARQVTPANRPLYQSGPSRIVADGVNDALVTKFAASLGTDCTVARAVPDVGASILTGQTITTSYSDTESHAGLVIINRALTAKETSRLSSYLNKLSGAALAAVLLVDNYGAFLVDSLGNYLVA